MRPGCAFRWWASILVVCSLPAAAPAQTEATRSSSQAFWLRVSPSMHTAVVRRIAADAGCKLVATASDDKTIRLWRLSQGTPAQASLLRVLRPSIGPGDAGKVYAVGVAPDGSWVAGGGWDAATSQTRSTFVSIFDPNTGKVISRLGPLGNVIAHLAVSHDGEYLAATLLAGEGLRVWKSSGGKDGSWQLVLEDTDYGGKGSYGAAFDQHGALYTVALDGKIRRYSSGFKERPAVSDTRGGTEPVSVAVHPSGQRLAVGYKDRAVVDVYESRTLEWMLSPDLTGIEKGDLFATAWSSDGKRLFAAGRYEKDGQFPVLVWDSAGKRLDRSIDGPTDSVQHIIPCGTAVAVAAADPAFGLITADGRRSGWQDRAQLDMRGMLGERFALSPDGSRIRLGMSSNDAADVMVFDIALESLSETSTHPSARFTGAKIGTLPITDWINSYSPNLAGLPIKLDEYERARSLAISFDSERFVIGGDWTLRAFDKGGKQLWQAEAEAAVWGVNIPDRTGLVVGAYGDGTVRWHRLSDGQELLALFVHKIDRRWVAWTPKGYYIASPGAESLIGWHVNGETWDEAPQFYPADRFREQFNRPDIVKMVLETLDERQAIEEANKRANVVRAVENVRAAAPPIIIIQSPGDGATFRSPQVTIAYSIFSESGKATEIAEVRFDNSTLRSAPLPSTKKNKSWSSGEHVLTLPPQDVTVTFVARDEDSKLSEPVSIRLKWDGPKAGQVAQPQLRALFVGVDDYTALNKLNYAAKDASDLAAFFKQQGGKSFSKVVTNVLPRDAKRADVLKGLEWLERESEKGGIGDVNLLFLAGHGVMDDRMNFFFMAADSDPKTLRATAVSKDDILHTIRNLKGARIVMLDACHSGGGIDPGNRADMSRAINELADQSLGVQMFASSQGRQYSEERGEWGNGAFTKAMLEGLSGKADSQNLGSIEADELGLYVRRRVEALTGKRQTPAHVLVSPSMPMVTIK